MSKSLDAEEVEAIFTSELNSKASEMEMSEREKYGNREKLTALQLKFHTWGFMRTESAQTTGVYLVLVPPSGALSNKSRDEHAQLRSFGIMSNC
jgi:hypothetical protein